MTEAHTEYCLVLTCNQIASVLRVVGIVYESTLFLREFFWLTVRAIHHLHGGYQFRRCCTRKLEIALVVTGWIASCRWKLHLKS